MTHPRSHRHHRRRSGRSRRASPWGGLRGRFFRPGELRLALLALLREGPKHGYELMKQLEERSGGLYRASAGSVYPTLQQIEDEALARSQSQDGKRVYRLTPEGESLLDEEAPDVRRIWRRADAWGDWSHAGSPEAWEVVRPALALAKAALRAVGEDADEAEIARVRAVLVRARREIEGGETTDDRP